MTTQEVIEQIQKFPVNEKIRLIEQISQSLLADLKTENIKQAQNNGETETLPLQERAAAIDRLYGIAAVEGKPAMTDEEIREDYTNYLMEKYS